MAVDRRSNDDYDDVAAGDHAHIEACVELPVVQNAVENLFTAKFAERNVPDSIRD
jgi:hypothetical protein